MKTNKDYTEAENETFLYQEWFGSILIHKESGKVISQMYWLDDNGRQSEPVIGELKEQVAAFWQEYYAIKNQAEKDQWQASINAAINYVPSAYEIAHEKLLRDMEDEYSDL